MASTAEAMIEEAMFQRLQGLAFTPSMPVAWPNVSFDPPQDHRYLRAQFVPNMADRALIGSDGPHRHMGLMQVSVYWTKGEGETAPRDIAGTVAAHFGCDLKLRNGPLTVRITKHPDVRDLIIEDAAIQIPVIIAWECWA